MGWEITNLLGAAGKKPVRSLLPTDGVAAAPAPASDDTRSRGDALNLTETAAQHEVHGKDVGYARTVADAQRAADSLFDLQPKEDASVIAQKPEADSSIFNPDPKEPFGSSFDPSAEAWNSIRRVERDASDVNVGSAALDKAAESQLEVNQPLEHSAMKKLSDHEQAQYLHVVNSLKSMPVAKLSLQMLLLSGKLTDNRVDQNGDNLLQGLAKLSEAPLNLNIDRPSLMSGLVREVETPSAISQHDSGTCSVTSLQEKMAIEDPAEYVRLVGGLASPEGSVTMANGDTLSRVPGTEKAGDLTLAHPDGSKATVPDKRSTSARLWQAALMQYGYGSDGKYDNATDSVKANVAPSAFSIARDMTALSGKVPDIISNQLMPGVMVECLDVDAMIARLQQTATPEHPVPTAMWFGPTGQAGGHEVLVTKVQNDRVYYNNPWGTQESMGVSDFKERVRGGYSHVESFTKTK